MSYKKAIKFASNPKKGKAQYMGFSVLAPDTRRRVPWLGGSWFKEGNEDKLKKYLKEWETETEELLKQNPNLKIVD